jgi:hypothetical protein
MTALSAKRAMCVTDEVRSAIGKDWDELIDMWVVATACESVPSPAVPS